jgi:DNA mismatch endonuclease, patch repair protein
MPGPLLAIFVDGCFWHSCPEHGRKTPFTGPNAPLWEQKMAKNVERDRRSSEVAASLGWTVVRIWECEIAADPAAAADAVLATADLESRRYALTDPPGAGR